MVHHAVEDVEPMARRGLGIGSVCPKLCQHPCVVPAGHDLRRIRLARGGIDVPPLAGVAPFFPVVELVVLRVFEVKQVRVHIAHRSWADVDHYAVGGVEVLGPSKHHAVTPSVGVGNALRVVQIDQRRCALVHPHRIRPAVACKVQGARTVRKPKRRDVAPFRTQEGRSSVSTTPLWPTKLVRLMLCHLLGCTKNGLPGTDSMKRSGLDGV